MRSEKTPTTENLIREIRELARLSEELTVSAHEIRAELAELQERLGIQQQLETQPCYARINKPN